MLASRFGWHRAGEWQRRRPSPTELVGVGGSQERAVYVLWRCPGRLIAQHVDHVLQRRMPNLHALVGVNLGLTHWDGVDDILGLCQRDLLPLVGVYGARAC